MRVLLIKLTSMGDLMHALPAITEASKHIPGIKFDWVVDKGFSEVPSWHPSVEKIITTDHRNWRKKFYTKSSATQISSLKDEINDGAYDVVVDMQNNLKSAFIAWLYQGQVHGMDRSSAREYPAHWAYSKAITIPKNLHAIKRQKILLSESLGYPVDNDSLDYGISISNFIEPSIKLPDNFSVLVQNASWNSKLWPINKWRDLILDIENKGLSVFLPSGNNKELERARKIVQDTNATALDLLPLNEVAFLISKARFCVCSDTGLAHLSAVVHTPSVTLYGPTDTKLIGTQGINQLHLSGDNKKMENIKTEDVLKKICSFT